MAAGADSGGRMEVSPFRRIGQRREMDSFRGDSVPFILPAHVSASHQDRGIPAELRVAFRGSLVQLPHGYRIQAAAAPRVIKRQTGRPELPIAGLGSWERVAFLLADAGADVIVRVEYGGILVEQSGLQMGVFQALRIYYLRLPIADETEPRSDARFFGPAGSKIEAGWIDALLARIKAIFVQQSQLMAALGQARKNLLEVFFDASHHVAVGSSDQDAHDMRSETMGWSAAKVCEISNRSS